MKQRSVVVAGAGPAGLTAAYELCKLGFRPQVYEKTSHIGGLSRTEIYRGNRFDIGGHRFFTKVHQINRLWGEVLGPELLQVRQISRIYYEGKFFAYPLGHFPRHP